MRVTHGLLLLALLCGGCGSEDIRAEARQAAETSDGPPLCNDGLPTCCQGPVCCGDAPCLLGIFSIAGVDTSTNRLTGSDTFGNQLTFQVTDSTQFFEADLTALPPNPIRPTFLAWNVLVQLPPNPVIPALMAQAGNLVRKSSGVARFAIAALPPNPISPNPVISLRPVP